MARPTKCIINLGKLKKNFSLIKSKTKKKVLALVKANAYGHGLFECAKALQQFGVDYLGTATLEEGQFLREAGISVPILCLGVLPFESEKICVDFDIEQAISTVDELKRLAEYAKSKNKTVNVHIKIETGMHRTGVRFGENLVKLLNEIKSSDSVTLRGVFTHFAESDSDSESYTFMQAEKFKKAVEFIKNEGFEDIIVHCSNSGAILQYPDLYFDMVRAGIILYGYYPSKETKQTIKIEPILSFKTSIVSINTLYKGEYVSYGCTFKAERDMVVAVLPVGYGDGYKRSISNRGYVLIHGEKAPVIGRICMDMTMVDVTDIHNVCLGDEAVLIGEQENAVISADDLAQWCETINYEIMLSITQRVNKEYVE